MAEQDNKKAAAGKGVETVEAVSAASSAGEARGLAKVRQGVVLSNKMNKTVVVKISRLVKHPTYGKYIRKTKKYYAHDQKRECQIGDVVEMVETRPLSKTKRWRVNKIVTKAV